MTDVMVGELSDRQAIVQACRKMASLGLNQGTSGNIGVRRDDGFLITPSGLSYDDMEPDDIVFMDWDGNWKVRGKAVPSSEWRFHLEILKNKPDVGAVVHAHPIYSTIIAILGLDIPAIHYMVAAAGGKDIPCAPYAQFATDDLSRLILVALRERRACLLAHHGLIATGANLAKAVWLANEVEVLARQFHGCLQVGNVPVLTDDQIGNVLRLWGSYGHETRGGDSVL